MKKVLSLAIVTVLALSVVACSKKKAEEVAPPVDATPAPVEQPAAPAAPAQN